MLCTAHGYHVQAVSSSSKRESILDLVQDASTSNESLNADSELQRVSASEDNTAKPKAAPSPTSGHLIR